MLLIQLNHIQFKGETQEIYRGIQDESVSYIV